MVVRLFLLALHSTGNLPSVSPPLIGCQLLMAPVSPRLLKDKWYGWMYGWEMGSSFLEGWKWNPSKYTLKFGFGFFMGAPFQFRNIQGSWVCKQMSEA